MKQLAIFSAALALFACAPDSGPFGDTPAPAAVIDSPWAFKVQLTLTPRTIEQLVRAEEMITISAMYWGEPKAGPNGGEIGQVNLGAADIRVEPSSRAINIPGDAINSEILDTRVQGPPQVLVNVFTSRLSQENNLINCGIYEGPISMAQQKPVEIECDLIDQPVDEPASAEPAVAAESPT